MSVNRRHGRDKIADARAVDALGAAPRDEEADVREQAAWALGRVVR